MTDRQGMTDRQQIGPIPYDIYGTWESKELPPKMQECIDRLQQENPEFTYHLFDDTDRRQFISEYFPQDVVNAYDKLIPGAYRADLWRYCVLYKNGGVYLDIKYCTVPGFKLKELMDQEYFVRDIPESGGGIYNAVMICKPTNPILHKCIWQIVEHTKTNYYGESGLFPTGPMLMKRFFDETQLENISKSGIHFGADKDCPNNVMCLYWKNRPILSMYKEYRDEQTNFHSNSGVKKYYELWGDRNIYT